MYQVKDVLYVCDETIQLHREGAAAKACKQGQPPIHIPLCTIGQIISFAYQPATCGFMELCAQNGIAFAAVSPRGRLRFRVIGQTHGNVVLRQAQYQCFAEPAQSLALAKCIIRSKVENTSRLLQQFYHDHPQNTLVVQQRQELRRLSAEMEKCENADLLRGIEGICARGYFSVFDSMLLTQQQAFAFQGRNRRPPRDCVNALLSFAYAFLLHEYEAATDAVGLDPYVGCFHGVRSGKPALCLDFMEETRAMIADRFVLRLINLGIMKEELFETDEQDGVRLTEPGRKLFAEEWNRLKKREIGITGVEKKIPIGLVPFIQAQRLSAFLRNEAPEYLPLKSKK